MTMDVHGWPIMSACCTTGLGSTARSMGKWSPCNYTPKTENHASFSTPCLALD